MNSAAILQQCDAATRIVLIKDGSARDCLELFLIVDAAKVINKQVATLVVSSIAIAA